VGARIEVLANRLNAVHPPDDEGVNVDETAMEVATQVLDEPAPRAAKRGKAGAAAKRAANTNQSPSPLAGRREANANKGPLEPLFDQSRETDRSGATAASDEADNAKAGEDQRVVLGFGHGGDAGRGPAHVLVEGPDLNAIAIVDHDTVVVVGSTDESEAAKHDRD